MDEESKALTTIVTPHGKYEYFRMAMGLKVSPDVAQSMIENIYKGLNVKVYIDDIGIFSDTYEDHTQLVNLVLERLESIGPKVNPLKCEWCIQQTDFWAIG